MGFSRQPRNPHGTFIIEAISKNSDGCKLSAQRLEGNSWGMLALRQGHILFSIRPASVPLVICCPRSHLSLISSRLGASKGNGEGKLET